MNQIRSASARIRSAVVETLELRRLLAAGNPDFAFGDRGAAITMAATRRPQAIVLQNDGSFLIASVGGMFNGERDVRNAVSITRYRSDGALDRSFGVDGHKSYQPLEGELSISRGFRTSDDGLLIVLLSKLDYYDGVDYARLLKFTANGEIDLSFGGGDGQVDVLTLPGMPQHYATESVNTLMVGPNGRIYYTTYDGVPGNHGESVSIASLHALSSDGEPDTAWGDAGVIRVSSRHSSAYQIDSTDRVWAHSYEFNGVATINTLRRFRADGSPDHNYGAKRFSFADLEAVRLVSVLADNRLVFSNMNGDGYNYDRQTLKLRRVTPNGKLDTTYGGGDGAIDVPVPRENDDQDKPLLIAPDGRVVYIHSNQEYVYRDDPYGITVVRSNGTLDPQFSDDGQQFHDLPFIYADSAAVLQPDGKFVIAGATFDPIDVGLIRYGTDGEFDPTLDGDGIVLPGPANRLLGEFNDAIVQSDGKTIAVGRVGRGGVNDLLVARYTPAGALDNSFAGKGWIKLDFGRVGGGRDDVGLQIFAVAGGKYLAVATSGFARINANGTLDSAFGTGGILKTRVAQAQLTANGRIVFADGGATLHRLNANGSIDSAFSTFAPPQPYRALKLDRVVAYPGSRWLASGTLDIDEAVSDRTVMMRFHADGSRDTSFDGDAMAFPKNERINILAVAPDAGIRYVTHKSAFQPGYEGPGYYSHKASFGSLRSNGKAGATENEFESYVGTSPTDDVDMVIRDVHIQSDGKMLVVADGGPSFGYAGDYYDPIASEPQYGRTIARLLPNGLRDPTFDLDGIASIAFDYLGGRKPRYAGSTDFANMVNANAIAQAPDGSIVVVGGAHWSNTVPFVGRFRAGTGDAVSVTSGRRLLIEGTSGDDRITSAVLNDGRIQITMNGRAFAFEPHQFEFVVAAGNAGSDQIDLSVISREIHMRGGAGNDTLTTGRGKDTIRGDEGNDVISGWSGDDHLSDDAGVNTLSGGSGNDEMFLSGSGGAMFGGTGHDSLRVSALRATLGGGAGHDQLYTAFSDNNLPAGALDLTFSGGAGSDSLLPYPAPGSQILRGDEDDDRVDFSSFPTGVAVSLDGVANDGRGGDAINVMPGIETITGSPYNDRIIGSEAGEFFIGGYGNDVIHGLGGNDTLVGDFESDSTRAGRDSLFGGAGNDDLIESDDYQRDRFDGGAGHDRVKGPIKNDHRVDIEELLSD